MRLGVMLPGGLALALACACGDGDHETSESYPSDSGSALHAGYVGSARCALCHYEIAAAWRTSHHAGAEREIDPLLDAPAFASTEPIHHGSQESRVRATDGRLEILTTGPGEELAAFPVARAIGVDPLRQYLVAAAGGRWQATELAFDPARSEWFDVFGDEDRTSTEWGHWSNRGMCWNSQCADCHVTDLVKGYEPASDSYRTTWSELGIGCEACHGPGAAHVELHERGRAAGATEHLFPAGAPAERLLDLCGTCHSRRSELVERFVPGEALLDAFLPEIPGLSEVYYADGQVHEEDYEYVSFALSALHGGGVTCTSCHDPHSGRTRITGDALCLSCHAQPIVETIAQIDATTHSRHDPAGAGARCIACHMPQTTYMQRHARHDHGFTIPDPRLTLELGIPNACARCHADHDAAWATEAAERLFGAAIDHGQRLRARTIVAVRRDDPDGGERILQWLAQEKSPAWRAVAADLSASYASVPAVRSALELLAGDESALVRANAARSLEAALPLARPTLRRLLEDPSRAVRVLAAFGLRGELDLASRAGQDLSAWLAQAADQPGGLYQSANVACSRGALQTGIELLERAARWDPRSLPIWESLAPALALAGRSADALNACERACALDPRVATHWHALGLARAEVHDFEGARAALEEAVRLEPTYSRAWYDLGLLANSMHDTQAADRALERATSLEPENTASWFAWAAVLRDSGDLERARWAAGQVLAIDPADARARALLQELH